MAGVGLYDDFDFGIVPADSSYLQGLHREQEEAFRVQDKTHEEVGTSKVKATEGDRRRGRRERGSMEPPNALCNGAPPHLGKIAGRFMLDHRLGSGTFGEVYLAVDTLNGRQYAAKLEKVNASDDQAQLHHEAQMLKHLCGVSGISNMYHFGTQNNFNVLLMDYLGPSLENLFNRSDRRFSLKTVLMLAEQILTRMEYLHGKAFIHRDIKPENFVVGRDDEIGLVYLIDFGLAKRYRRSKVSSHIHYREGCSLTGTARYASINAHRGIEQSRRDDLEAVGYMLIYFMKGSLPWQGIRDGTKEERYQKIVECKSGMPVEDMCRPDVPLAFAGYLHYCKSLRFTDLPDYAHMQKIFKDVLSLARIWNDRVFDWVLKSTEDKNRPTPSTSAETKLEFQRRVDAAYCNQVDGYDGDTNQVHVSEQVTATTPKKRSYPRSMMSSLTGVFGCGNAHKPHE
mmetsp:Transcript_47432/g.112785  ORF Transcript_47432/g.112785 Transcript_47432/m.112785 type:complete len:454 (+) Transcript_47432:99-1460(+)